MQTLTFSRPTKDIDSANYRMSIHRGKYNQDRKFLGSLFLEYSMQDKNETLFDKCTPQEIIQLKEYVNVYNKMRRCLGTSNKTMGAFRLQFDKNFPDILYDISEKAYQAGIEFLPQDFIVDSLLFKISEISEQVDLKDIYKKYQFQPDYKKPLSKRPSIDERKDLIEAVLNIKDTPEKIEQVFNDNLLEQYNKSKGLTYDKLEDMIKPESKEKIKIFWLSNAIDTLVLYGKNPTEIISKDIVFEYWLSPRVKFFSETAAITQFCSEFDINDQNIIDQLLTIAIDLYSRPIAVNHIFRNNP